MRCLLGWVLAVSGAGAEPLIVAHRGASGDAPENTLPAFALAWERGADAIEGDFRLTKDGVIVCVHDEDTKRVSGVKKKVKESTFAELRGLDVGGWRGEAWKGIRIPTLGEVMATVPEGKKIYVEIKCGPEVVPTLLTEVRESGLGREQVVFISFQASVVGALKKERPEMESYWLVSFKRKGTGEITPSAGTVFGVLEKTGADGLSTGKDHVSAEFVALVKGKGHGYHVWTVDDLADARRFAVWGAESITTNVPGRIRAGLGR